MLQSHPSTNKLTLAIYLFSLSGNVGNILFFPFKTAGLSLAPQISTKIDIRNGINSKPEMNWRYRGLGTSSPRKSAKYKKSGRLKLLLVSPTVASRPLFAVNSVEFLKNKLFDIQNNSGTKRPANLTQERKIYFWWFKYLGMLGGFVKLRYRHDQLIKANFTITCFNNRNASINLWSANISFPF